MASTEEVLLVTLDASENTASHRLAGAGGKWVIFALLMCGMVLSLVDRQIIALLVEPIKADLSLTDTQFSLLVGPAFVAFYMVFGIPFGWAADKFDRTVVIAFGILIWSFATIACGLAGGFVFLFMARALVGAGEASLTPSSMSILSDLFSRERLPFITSVFFISLHIGGAAAMLIGGVVLSALSDIEQLVVPVFGALAPWELTFVIVGAPGLLLAFVFLFSAEPRRQSENALSANHQSSDGQRDRLALSTDNADEHFWPFIQLNKTTLTVQFVAAAVLAIGTAGITAWAPAYLIRVHALAEGQAALGLGLFLLVCGPAGTVLGGALSGRLIRKRARYDAPWLVMGLSALGTGVFGVLLFSTGSLLMTTIAAAPAVFLGSMYLGVVHAAVQMITPARLRGRLAAMLLFVMTGIGAMLGPVIIALMTDHVFGSPDRVGSSLAVVSAGVGVIVTSIIAFNLHAYRQSYSRAQLA